MKFVYMSDLHLEFTSLEVPAPNEPAVLLLAGDVAVGKRKSTYPAFLADCIEKFDHVVYVPGNHEFYGGNLDTTWNSMKAKMAEHLRDQGFDRYLHMLNNEVLDLGEVVVLGSTLWTALENSYAATVAGMYMNDYRVIRRGENYRKVTPMDTIGEHHKSRYWLFKELEKLRDRKVVVMTHHAPSFLSVHPKYAGDSLNPCYASNLDEEIEQVGKPDVWVHGHMHDSVDYWVGNTHVLSNPRGYSGQHMGSDPENPKFDPSKSFEL